MPWTDGFAGAVASGALPNPDAVLQVRASVDVDSGMRAIEAVPAGGIAIRVLPDRGLDVGAAHFAGVPIAWVSATGEVGPLSAPRGHAWGDAFGGGLITTCGLRNVGAPSEGHGLHGTFSHLPAGDVVVERSVDHATIEVRGVVTDNADPGPLRVERSVVTHAGVGRVVLTDTTMNLAGVDVPVPMLYHCNLGWPLWRPGARLGVDVAATVARDPESEPALGVWEQAPALAEGPEWVLEHVPVADVDGRAMAYVTNEELGLRLTISWDAHTLPYLNQWIDRRPSMAVLGIEPANCTTRGIAHERRRGTLPILEAGAHRTTSVTVECEPT